jgi:hypothetical protein
MGATIFSRNTLVYGRLANEARERRVFFVRTVLAAIAHSNQGRVDCRLASSDRTGIQVDRPAASNIRVALGIGRSNEIRGSRSGE